MKLSARKLIAIFTAVFVILSLPLFSLAASVDTLTFAKTTDARVTISRTITRTARVAPAGTTVTYKSSDTDIATVDENGKVKGIALGETVITAFAGGQKVSYNVKVVPYISFKDKEDIVLNIGEVFRRKATASPEGDITYKSSDTDVVTVDSSGKVVAITAGTAKIGAFCGGGSASYDVIVEYGDSALESTKNAKVECTVCDGVGEIISTKAEYYGDVWNRSWKLETTVKKCHVCNGTGMVSWFN